MANCPTAKNPRAILGSVRLSILIRGSAHILPKTMFLQKEKSYNNDFIYPNDRMHLSYDFC